VVPIGHSYQAALASAEMALIQGRRLVVSEPGTHTTTGSLHDLRAELLQALDQSPLALTTLFERYLQVVTARAGYGSEATHARLEVVFEMLADALVSSGRLEPKGRATLAEALGRAVSSSRTLADLLAAYRRSVEDLAKATEDSVSARQERSLRSALAHIKLHYTEPLRLERVAKLSGFAPKYFSKIFKRHEGKGFGEYVLALKIERARRLLSSTEFDIGRVAKLSGFASEQYFCRMFRRETGRTALEYRRLRASRSDEIVQKQRHRTTKKRASRRLS
jgi:AraC-like DNA-binding protein